ncbi:MAG: anti-sigma factor family protein [Pirellulales bacterium]
MQCAEFRTLLNRLLDQRRPPESDARLRSHARECSECHAFLAAHEALLSGLKGLPMPEPEDGLAERVLLELRPARPARRLLYRFVMPLAAAAAVVVVLTPLWRSAWQNSTGPARPSVDRVVRSEPKAHSPAVGGAVAPRTRTFAESGEQYAALARETGESLAAVVRQSHRPRWMQQVASGLKPLASPAKPAFNAVLRAIPSTERDSRS